MSGKPLEHSQGRSTSIVIPAYNAQRFLARTLESALAQDHDVFDIIVVDDGSTDRTAEIASEYGKKDRRVHLISTRNGGVAAARNVGIFASTSEFVAFLDADDLWHHSKLRTQVDTLQAKDNYAAVYTWSATIDETDMVLQPNLSWNLDGYIFCRHLMTWPVGNGSSLVVRRTAALAVGGFDTSFRKLGSEGAEDLDFELRIAERYKITCVPSFLVGYRRYQGNMSSDREKMVKSTILAVNKALERHPDLPKTYSRWARAKAYRYAVDVSRPSFDLVYYFLLLLILDTPVGLRAGAAKARSLIHSVLRRLGIRESDIRILVSFTEWTPPDYSGIRYSGSLIERRMERLISIDRRFRIDAL